MKKKIFKYELHRASKLETEFNNPGDIVAFTLDEMNKLGAEGKRVIGAPIEFNEPSTLSVAGGSRPLIKYGIMLFTEELVTVEDSPI